MIVLRPMSESEKRQSANREGETMRATSATKLDECPMTADPLILERVATPTGPMRIVSDQEGNLCGLDWEDCAPRLQELLRRYHGSSFPLRETRNQSVAARSLLAYFAGELDAITPLPTAAGGTPFQRAVWSALRRIPAGRTMSYSALAAAIGRPKAVRAVGLANGANPIAIVVPCHRVIGADASLTGYGGGIERKRWLLAHESGSLPLFERSHLVSGA
jgi:methylated-DNA-[protein]-cysteine S-methyltransferase